MATERVLLLYHTAGCHLCELAETLVAPVAAARDRPLRRVEIAGEETLEARYGVRIPVLRDPQADREIGWPFTAAEVLALIDGG